MGSLRTSSNDSMSISVKFFSHWECDFWRMGESGDYLDYRVQMTWVCRTFCWGMKEERLKVYADKSIAMMLGGEERLECEIRVDGARLEKV